MGEAHFYNLDGDEIEKQTTEIKWNAEAAEKAGFEHFMLCVLVNIPRKKKSLNKRFVETSAFCEILDCSVGCSVVQGQVKRCGRCCAGFALSLGAFAG